MPRGRTKAFDRSKALDQAMKLFWEKGYGSTGLIALQKRMRIGRQSLYDTFGDKKLLFLEALDHYMASFIAIQINRLESPGSPLENIRAVLNMYEQHTTSGNGLGCLLANSLAEFGSHDPVMSARLKDKVSQLEYAFRDCLRRAQASGEIAKDRDVEGLARMLLSTAFGVSLMGRLGVNKKLIQDILRMVEELVL